ncbi:MAG: ShlB/FhaC/HecB family hemolysin secretion/activation protein [Magnetococcales bacterium]|nr:ShlB/FhaC/HecB family hemolysin secretion/activation protein [Magnetococcales bacterium]MBF0115061.1 ShlB/FhaC/HecB family hemolysin secretion/activation protein [Magnetococcales bacterium]
MKNKSPNYKFFLLIHAIFLTAGTTSALAQTSPQSTIVIPKQFFEPFDKRMKVPSEIEIRDPAALSDETGDICIDAQGKCSELREQTVNLPLRLEFTKTSETGQSDRINSKKDGSHENEENYSSGGYKKCDNNSSVHDDGTVYYPIIDRQLIKHYIREITGLKTEIKEIQSPDNPVLSFEIQGDDKKSVISLLEIMQIIKKMNDYYRSEDYYSSFAYLPNQTIDNLARERKMNIAVNEPPLDIEFVVRDRSRDRSKDRSKDGSERESQENRFSELVKEHYCQLAGVANAPVRRNDLESFIVRLNSLPGISVNVVVRPVFNSGEKDQLSHINKFKMEIDYDYNNYEIQVSYDNYGSLFMGPRLFMLNSAYNFENGSRVALSRVQTDYPDELKYFKMEAVTPLDNLTSFNRTNRGRDSFLKTGKFDLVGSISYNRASPAHTLKTMDIDNSILELIGGLRFHYWRGRYEAKFLQDYLSGVRQNSSEPNAVLFDYTGDHRIDVLYQDYKARMSVLSGLPYTEDIIRSFTVQHVTDARGKLNLLNVPRIFGTKYRFREQFELSSNIGYTKGVRFGGETEKGSILSTRAEADPSFWKLSGDLKVSYMLKNFPFWRSSFIASTQLEGQYADQPLFAGQEISIGNRNGARGYAPSEMSGDSGYGCRNEFGFTFLDSFAKNTDPEYEYKDNKVVGLKTHFNKSLIEFLQKDSIIHFYYFIDISKITNRDRSVVGTTEDKDSLKANGVGLRIQHEDGLSFSLELAKPLGRTPYNTSDPSYLNGGDTQTYFKFSMNEKFYHTMKKMFDSSVR